MGLQLYTYVLHYVALSFQRDSIRFFTENYIQLLQTNSSSVPGPFLSNVSHVWEAQQVKLYEDTDR